MRRIATMLLPLTLVPLSLALAVSGEPVELQTSVDAVDEGAAKDLARKFCQAVLTPRREGARAQVMLRHRALPAKETQQPEPIAAPQEGIEQQTETKTHQALRHKVEQRHRHRWRRSKRSRMSKQVSAPAPKTLDTRAQKTHLGKHLLEDASRLMKQSRQGPGQQGAGPGQDPGRGKQGDRLHELPTAKRKRTGKPAGKPEEGSGVGQGGERGSHGGPMSGARPGSGFGSGGSKGKGGTGGPRR